MKSWILKKLKLVTLEEYNKIKIPYEATLKEFQDGIKTELENIELARNYKIIIYKDCNNYRWQLKREKQPAMIYSKKSFKTKKGIYDNINGLKHFFRYIPIEEMKGV